MSLFKRMVTKAGKVHFFRNGKPVDPMTVPVEVHATLAGDETREMEFLETTVVDGHAEETELEKRGISPADVFGNEDEKEETETDSEDQGEDKADVQEERIFSGLGTPPPLQHADRNSQISYLSGEPAAKTRWLNGIEYWLTEEEYQSLNLGRLAQAVREKDEQNQKEK